jgi:hypothetical protein
MYYMFRPIVAIIRHVRFYRYFLSPIPPYGGACLYIRSALYTYVVYVILLQHILNIKVLYT